MKREMSIGIEEASSIRVDSNRWQDDDKAIAWEVLLEKAMQETRLKLLRDYVLDYDNKKYYLRKPKPREKFDYSATTGCAKISFQECERIK